MAEDIEGIREPAVFTQLKRYAVTRTQRASDMGRIAETMNDLRREPQFLADLMPHRHQLDGARIGEAERFTPDPLLDKSGDLAPDIRDAGIRPPRDGQRKIGAWLIAVPLEQVEDAVVETGDFPPLPMFRGAVALCRLRSRARRLIRHLDAERAQRPRAQRCAAPVHAEHDDDRAPLPCRRQGRDRARQDLSDQASRSRHTVVHAARPFTAPRNHSLPPPPPPFYP